MKANRGRQQQRCRLKQKRPSGVAWVEDGKNVGEASKLAGIDNTDVAAALVLQCHRTVHLPLRVDELT